MVPSVGAGWHLFLCHSGGGTQSPSLALKLKVHLRGRDAVLGAREVAGEFRKPPHISEACLQPQSSAGDRVQPPPFWALQ